MSVTIVEMTYLQVGNHIKILAEALASQISEAQDDALFQVNGHRLAQVERI
jgi:hypothetical protein